VPYYGANTLVQLETTITNWNILGFVGSATPSARIPCLELT
jgi:hypothetical protein